MKEFNVNNNVFVRLTDYGREIHKADYDRLARDFDGKLPWKYEPPKEDKDGWSKWQMWDLMNIFGFACKMGFNVPFETTIRIEIE